MRNTITISLSKEMSKQLDEITHESGVTRSEVVRESLRGYLWKAEFRKLRKLGLKRAAQKGIFTDQDVFDRVS